MRNRTSIALGGAQRQAVLAAAAANDVNEDDLEAAVRERLVPIVGHRNGRPSNVQLQSAIEAALTEFQS